MVSEDGDFLASFPPDPGLPRPLPHPWLLISLQL